MSFNAMEIHNYEHTPRSNIEVWLQQKYPQLETERVADLMDGQSSTELLESVAKAIAKSFNDELNANKREIKLLHEALAAKNAFSFNVKTNTQGWVVLLAFVLGAALTYLLIRHVL